MIAERLKEQLDHSEKRTNKSMGIKCLFLGGVVLIAILGIMIYQMVNVPTDYVSKGTVQAEAYQVEQSGQSYYVHYKAIGTTFRERVSSEVYADSRISGRTVEREAFYSKAHDKYYFSEELNVSPSEITSKERLENIAIYIFFAILGFVFIGIGIWQIKKAKDIAKEQ
ncbi:MAG TPA: hypothetical protein VHQ24_18010, partial [Lachnospiraceae bacterium]|nr:hypothetical protein [Lachnospiraceae bacterium]